MADHADIAGDTLEVCLADAERRARSKSAPEAQPDFARWDGATCVEEACGVALPQGRIDAQRCRCTDCQTFLEKKQ